MPNIWMRLQSSSFPPELTDHCSGKRNCLRIIGVWNNFVGPLLYLRDSKLQAATQNKFRGANDGNVLKKIPSMIMNNGILATAAFTLESKGEGYSDVFEAIIQHLNDENIKSLLGDKGIRTTKQLIDFLSESTSSRLRDITAESMAYLNYLSRFAEKTKTTSEGAL